MRTLYDWHPEHRGWLLMPEGSTLLRQGVVLSKLCGHNTLLECTREDTSPAKLSWTRWLVTARIARRHEDG